MPIKFNIFFNTIQLLGPIDNELIIFVLLHHILLKI
jgi:hypothetical protein